jgi:hypothetical protein
VPKAILAVYANPAAPEREDEFNTWYIETHIPEVLGLEGFVGARRYELSAAQLGGSSEHRYVTHYDIDAPDVQQALKSLTDGFRNGKVTMNDSMAPGPIVVWEERTSAPASA